MDAKDFKPNLTWKSTPANKLGAVGYIAFTKGSYNLIANQFLYGDCLYADLGPVGEVTVITRPIPAGTYNIRFFSCERNGWAEFPAFPRWRKERSS